MYGMFTLDRRDRQLVADDTRGAARGHGRVALAGRGIRETSGRSGRQTGKTAGLMRLAGHTIQKIKQPVAGLGPF